MLYWNSQFISHNFFLIVSLFCFHTQSWNYKQGKGPHVKFHNFHHRKITWCCKVTGKGLLFFAGLAFICVISSINEINETSETCWLQFVIFKNIFINILDSFPDKELYPVSGSPRLIYWIMKNKLFSEITISTKYNKI